MEKLQHPVRTDALNLTNTVTKNAAYLGHLSEHKSRDRMNAVS
jgi:hypothetical protein